MTQGPIEINERDLIPRPENIQPGQRTAMSGAGESGGGPMSWIKDLKAGLEMFSELRKMAGGMGLNLGALGGNMAAPEAAVSGPTPAQQLQQLIRLIMMLYGDVTLDELIARLRGQYGGKHLSEFLGGGQPK